MLITINLKSITQDQVPLVGRKSLNLSKMMQEGIQVPDGFVVTTFAYKNFIDTLDLPNELPQEQKNLEKFCTEIQSKIMSKTLPEKIVDKINSLYEEYDGQSLAVRSSAIDEDTESKSFAGQYDTFLGINSKEELCHAILKCWASAWNYNVFSYHLKNDTEFGPGNIAVIVQKMVNAKSSGVIFTQSPFADHKGAMLIDAGWGLGESIVSGKTFTDSYIVEKTNDDIINKTIRYKNIAYILQEDGTAKYTALENSLRNKQVLTDSEIVEIGKIAQKILQLFQKEQDIEWAHDKDKFYILQARDITTLPKEEKPENYDPTIKEEDILWTIVDAGEAFIGDFTTLGASYYRHMRDTVLGEFWHGLGLKFIDDPKKYGRFFHGRLYVNASHLAWLFAQTILAQDQQVTLYHFSEGLDLSDYKNPYGQSPVRGWQYFLSNIYYFKTMLKIFTIAKSRSDKEVERRFQDFDRFFKLDLKKLSLQELDKELKSINKYLLSAGNHYMPFWLGQSVMFDILQDLCTAWLDDKDHSIPKKIKAGMSDLKTLDFVVEIWKLSKEVKQSEILTEIMQNNKSDKIMDKIANNPDTKEFHEKVSEFLRIHGVRGKQEVNLSEPRWLDKPGYIFESIKKYMTLDDSYDLIKELESSNRDGQKVRDELLKSVPWLKRKILSWVINTYIRFGKQREKTRQGYIRVMWQTRTIVYEAARRLVKIGILKDISEAAYITFHDVIKYLEGKDPKEIFVRTKIEANRREYLFNKSLPEPPICFIGDWDPLKTTIQTGTKVLQGLGTSPGKVTGKARVIENLEEQINEFQKDEILVAHFSDATWTPLFSLAAGIVVNIGATLSHSSIVAREFEIPAVVNTLRATRIIKTGDQLIVDGDTGKVYINCDEE